MTYNWVIFNKKTMEKVGEVFTNHSINLTDAIDLLDADRLEVVNIDDPDIMIDGKEYWSEDLDVCLISDFYRYMEIDALAEIVRNANSWDADGVEDAMNELCDRARYELRYNEQDPEIRKEIFAEIRNLAPEFLEGTPDESADQPDLIDFIGHPEQAEWLEIAYVLQDILNVELV